MKSLSRPQKIEMFIDVPFFGLVAGAVQTASGDHASAPPRALRVDVDDD